MKTQPRRKQTEKAAIDRRATDLAHGFSRADLLVTLAVVFILTLLGAVSNANGGGRNGGVLCQYNLGRLSAAWLMYSQESRGLLPTNLGWVNGWLDFSSNPANTSQADLTNGTIWPYVRPAQTQVYRCPEDSSRVTVAGLPVPRVRSYSMNWWMSGTGWAGSSWRAATRLSELNVPPPSGAFVFLDEREDSINDGAFIVDMAGYSPSNPTSLVMVDYPAGWHGKGANLSFADGHVELWRWRDARTVPVLKPGQSLPLNMPHPNNMDVRRLQAASGAWR